MTSRQRIFFGVILAAALCGCVDSQQAAIDQAYHDGRISSAERSRQTNELAEQRQAGAEAAMVQSQQQPTRNKKYDKLVSPQATENNGYIRNNEN